MQQTVLVIDDSPLIQEIFSDTLKNNNINVLQTFDGLSGIKTALSKMPDLIILDIKMPKINGYQVCRLLKDHKSTSHIPIIIMTGSSKQDLIEDPESWSFEIGADAFIEKSSDMDLMKIIKPYLDKVSSGKLQKSPDPDILSNDDIMIAISNLFHKQLYTDVTRLKTLNNKLKTEITNKLKAEKEKEEMQRHIYNSSKMESIYLLSGGLSHELNNPLTVIRLNAEEGLDILEEPSINKTVLSDIFKKIQSHVERMSSIIDNFKQFSMKTKNEIKSNSIHKLIDNSFLFFNMQLKNDFIQVIKNFYTTDIICECDASKIEHAFISLILNSKDALMNSSNKEIKITTSLENNQAVIIFEDSGEGIKPEIQHRVFEAFFTTKDVNKGKGLGLHTTYRDITYHNGKIELLPATELKGACFKITLPLKQTTA